MKKTQNDYQKTMNWYKSNRIKLNKQCDEDDYHMWCVDKNKNIKDNFMLINSSVKVIHKEWKEIPDNVKKLIEKYTYDINSLDKKGKLILYKMLNTMDNRCAQYSVLNNILFGYEIKVGSLGIICDDDDILWEFGNGKKWADY